MCWYTWIYFKPYTWVIFIKEHIEFQISEGCEAKPLMLQHSIPELCGHGKRQSPRHFRSDWMRSVTSWLLPGHVLTRLQFQKSPFASKWYQLSIYIAPFDCNLGLSDVSRKLLNYCHGIPDTVDTSTIVWSLGMACRYPRDCSWVMGGGASSLGRMLLDKEKDGTKQCCSFSSAK